MARSAASSSAATPRNLPLPNIFSDIGPNEEVGQRSPEADPHPLVWIVQCRLTLRILVF